MLLKVKKQFKVNKLNSDFQGIIVGQQFLFGFVFFPY